MFGKIEKKSAYELTCDYYVRKAKQNMGEKFGVTVETVNAAHKKANQFNTVTAYAVLNKKYGR